MSAKLEYGDTVKIITPREFRPVLEGTTAAAFEGQVGTVVGEEHLGPIMYRVRFPKPINVCGVEVKDDLWERKFLHKQRS